MKSVVVLGGDVPCTQKIHSRDCDLRDKALLCFIAFINFSFCIVLLLKMFSPFRVALDFSVFTSNSRFITLLHGKVPHFHEEILALLLWSVCLGSRDKESTVLAALI